jgi:ADP-dependent NAD(P)H-hydrate dehydratase
MSGRRGVERVQLVTDRLLREWPLPSLEPGADKQARGDVLVVGGSREIPGAVLLAGEAALRAGAGRVRIATAREVAHAAATAFPEALVIGLPTTAGGELSGRGLEGVNPALAACTAMLLGPGMREERAALALVSQARRTRARCALVLDAAALRVLQGQVAFARGRLRGVIATPHAGEMAELWGCKRSEVERAALGLARAAARKLEVCIVLKGKETWVAAPDGRVFHNVAGNVGLATAGSGDCLAGVIAGLAARGADEVQAAVWGVYLHARAGERLRRKFGLLGYLARELGAEVPWLLDALTRRRRAD